MSPALVQRTAWRLATSINSPPPRSAKLSLRNGTERVGRSQAAQMPAMTIDSAVLRARMQRTALRSDQHKWTRYLEGPYTEHWSRPGTVARGHISASLGIPVTQIDGSVLCPVPPPPPSAPQLADGRTTRRMPAELWLSPGTTTRSRSSLAPAMADLFGGHLHGTDCLRGGG